MVEDNYEIFINDLKAMAETAYDRCKEEHCVGCKNIDDCMLSLRNAIGDLAQSQSWIIEQLKCLDHTVADFADIIPKKEKSKKEQSYFT